MIAVVPVAVSETLALVVLHGVGESPEWQLGERSKELRRWIAASRRLGLFTPPVWAALRLAFEVSVHAGPYSNRQYELDLKILREHDQEHGACGLLKSAHHAYFVRRGLKPQSE